MTDDVRVRLEGRLEVLENAAATLEALTALARSPRWENQAAQVRELITRYQVLAPRLPESRGAALALGEKTTPRRLDDAQRALEEALSRLESVEERARARNPSQSVQPERSRGPLRHQPRLEARLDLWLRLAEHTGVRREGLPLASATARVRSPLWTFLAAGGLVTLFFHPVAGLLLLAGAAATRHFLAWEVTFRLFAEALEVDEPGAPLRSVPLASVEPVEARPGVTLRGLRAVTLPGDPRLAPLCATLNALFAERAELARQEQALSAFAGEPVEGRWIPAVLSGRDREANEALRGPVPVVKFGRRSGGAGAALLSARGLLFIAQTAEPSVRKALFGTELIRLRAQQRPLLSFPAGLLLARLAELRELPGVVWLDAAEHPTWVADSDQQHVALARGRLSLRLDDAARAQLRAVWPT